MTYVIAQPCVDLKDKACIEECPVIPRVDLVTFEGKRGLPVYVIDPNGFVILRYAAGSDPGDLRSDLAKLLKLK